jgi:hypothetical protein
MIVRSAAICLGLLLLDGCATGPAIQGWGDGHLPQGAQTYYINAEAVAPGARAEVISAVRSALLSDGWRETTANDGWIVEVTYAVRPMVVGAYSDESARRQMWDLPPSFPYVWTRDRDVHVLNLTLARPQDGLTDISVGAAKRVGRVVERDTLQDLARTAVSRLHGGL